MVKFKNLKILRDNGFNVPDFTTDIESVTWDLSAVRSSADLEDTDNSSCAGLFDSFLNVPKNELREKIDLVRNSYSQNGGNIDSPVVIQRMVNSELSGVLFTANPMGILNEMVIVVGNGLGCNVVDNRVDTTTYYFNIDDNLYDFQQIDNSPLLTEEQIKELVSLGSKIEKLFDKKMDIEFGIENGEIYILQARPITTISDKNILILDNSNIVESYPGVSLPLTQSFVKEVYYKIFKRCIERISGDKELVKSLDGNLQNMVDIANGRIYYRISNWYSILRLLPFEKKIIKNWQKMLGVRNLTVVSDDVKVRFGTKLKILFNFVKYLCRTPEEMLKLNKFFDNKIVESRAKFAKCKSIIEYLNLLESLKKSFISNWDITLINDMYTFIYTGLSGEKNKQLLSDIRGLESLKPMIKLNGLIDAYHINGANSYKYKMLAKEYINSYGDRCMGELKLETETYKTNPTLLEDCVKNQKRVMIDKKYDESILKISNPFVKRAKLGIANREKSRMNRSKLFGLTRDIYLEIGKLLVKQGRLSFYRDIFYLYHKELYDNSLDYKQLVRERKIEYYNYEKIPTYSRLVFSDKIINKTNIGSVSVLSDNKLRGVGVSEGIVEGEIIVIDEPEIIDVSDKIIVTKMTDPGWVFLIRNCKGIIAQQGSLLSHTAIISRELGKPAIVNVKNVLQLLKTGDKVRINGLTGDIEKI